METRKFKFLKITQKYVSSTKCVVYSVIFSMFYIARKGIGRSGYFMPAELFGTLA